MRLRNEYHYYFDYTNDIHCWILLWIYGCTMSEKFEPEWSLVELSQRNPTKRDLKHEIYRAYAHIDTIEHENYLLMNQTQSVSKTHTGRVIVELERLAKYIIKLKELKTKADKMADFYFCANQTGLKQDELAREYLEAAKEFVDARD